MRAFSLLVVLCLVFSAHGLFPKRLIQFNETSQQWLSEWDLEKLMFAPGMHHFMDVTDFDGQQLNPLGSDIPLPSAPSHQEYVNGLFKYVDQAFITDFITALSSYHSRYYRSTDGFTSSHFVYSTFNQYAQKYPESGITVQNVTGTGYSQVSVIATIPGTGPNKDSIVVIGGHLDSIGRIHTGRAPGADDDASGTSSVLEIFRVLISQGYKPDFTIQFMAYSGEEAGLLGSQAIANSYALAGKSVYAVLQLDMTGYDNGPIGIIADFTSTDLNSFLEQLVTTYTTLEYTSSLCGYGCSDHASWTKAGYRASFPFEAAFGKHNPHIHTPNDLLEHLDQAKLVQYVNLGISFAVELGGLVQ